MRGRSAQERRRVDEAARQFGLSPRSVIAATTPHRGWRKAWAILWGTGPLDFALAAGGALAVATAILVVVPLIAVAIGALVGPAR
ncbi:hypothetical protein D1610_11550 [Sphingomonas gilva]|uniref:Uncharacterized protein n=1 Tax=Sphingomonas gilva TaxID=2305907 RepID=A0A396RLG1_9SPHN|nr:hypothetical protein [Sphingomonas gilva]RHW17177.1 hypothetical protein D1610_11550 [Sphingomonas gilva]